MVSEWYKQLNTVSINKQPCQSIITGYIFKNTHTHVSIILMLAFVSKGLSLHVFLQPHATEFIACAGFATPLCCWPSIKTWQHTHTHMYAHKTAADCSGGFAVAEIFLHVLMSFSPADRQNSYCGALFTRRREQRRDKSDHVSTQIKHKRARARPVSNTFRSEI